MHPLFYRLLLLDRRVGARIERESARPAPSPWRLLRLRLLRLSVRARLSGTVARMAG